MLSALDEKGCLVNLAVTIPERQHFTCPACGAEVRLKNGSVMRPHFAHINLKDCQSFSENEGPEHLGLKTELYRSLSRNCKVRVEQSLPEIQQIADLLVEDKLALEVQCSRLSNQRLRERTRDYHKQGYQVRWLLGRKLWLDKSLSDLQRDFLYFSDNMGFHLWELDLDRQCLRLKYLIYEDWHGRVHYLAKECHFTGDLLAFLRQPFVKQTMVSYRVAMDQQLLRYIQCQLYFQNPKWLKQQEAAYQRGDNLLTKSVEDFYPQLRPPQGPFCQIQQNLSSFYQRFEQFYNKVKDKKEQILYPPAFYGKIKTLKYKERKTPTSFKS
ncbi:competence protein CoiA [Streptococcus dentapri]|uniref:Competence protein CoiA n=1 Tax=Streptococcus dentapri TaxID=573564 RepID=A0ABV8D0P6_9STRE